MAQQTQPLGAERDTERGDGRHETRIAKVVELIGTSTSGFDDALQNALTDANETLHRIHGCEVLRHSVACDNGRIVEYRVDLRLAFGVER